MTSSHFDQIATIYDGSLPAHVVEHYLRKRARYVSELGHPGSALDVGCGTGALAQRLSAHGYTVAGVDPSEGMLEVLRARCPEVEAVLGSGTALPFEDDRFDLVLTVATLHHIAKPADVRRTLAEMVRVTRPGAKVLIWDHNPRNPYWSSLMARVPQDTGDERLISAAEVIDGLTTAGAEVLSCQELGFVPDFTPRAAIRAAGGAERLLERTPGVRRFGAHNVIVARKR